MSRLVVLLLYASAAAAPPVITKIEPPSWWVGHSYSTVRLMLRGSGFRDAQVHGARGLDVVEWKPNDQGTTLFVDVKVRRAGQYTLKVSTHDGSATTAFEGLTPLPAKGRFQGFSQNDLMYMIMTDRFVDGDPSNDKGDRKDPRDYHGGDFQGIIDRLAYLKDLGVSAIWITPAYENGNAYHGYHPIDFYKVEPHFGDIPKLRELVDKAHQNGIKIILDMVVNHTSASHPWLKDPPLEDWFHGTSEHHLNETFQIWTLLDPHAGHPMRDPVLDGWFANTLPDLNQDEPEVSKYLIQNTLWWIASTGVDGIRADTMPYVPRQFWHDWNAAIHKEYPNFKTLGEVFDSDPAVVSYFQGGSAKYDGVDTGMDALFDFPLYGGIRRAFAQAKPVAELAYITAHDSMYEDPSNLVTFLGNHDVSRFLNEAGSTIDGLKLAFTLLFTTRGLPMIYSGDEIALRGGDDPDNRRDFPGGWKDDSHNAFDPAQRTAEEREVFDYVRKLSLLRQQTKELRTGRLTQLGISRDVYVYTRGTLIVMFNNGSKPVSVQAPAAPGTWKNLLDVSMNVAVHDKVMTITVPARTAMIMMQR